MIIAAGLVAGGSAGPARADHLAGPATPARLTATNGISSITLTWTQPTTGVRPVSFRVYEGGTVVARNTTTHATVADLPFGSSHTYRVTAVDAAGRESAPSAPVSRQVFVGGAHACGITAPTGLTATDLTASAVSLSWSNEVPAYDEQGTLVVLRDGQEILTTGLDSARIGGLAPATTYSFQVARRDCLGQLHAGAPVTVTTAAGPTLRPVAPLGLTVGARTATSVALSWAYPGGAPVRFAVYEGGSRVATTTNTAVVVGRLWRDTAHEYTVAAIGPSGAESVHSPSVATSTLPCPDATTTPPFVNRPTQLAATATASSSVALTWRQVYEAGSYTVYRLGGAAPEPVVTTRRPSAMVTGLPPATTVDLAVVADTQCGESPMSAPVRASTPAGPAARPAAPTDLAVTGRVPSPDYNRPGTVTLAWTQPAGGSPPVGYRLYEGATLFAASETTSVTVSLFGGPFHSVTAVAVDAAGNESAQSAPLRFQAPFIPPP